MVALGLLGLKRNMRAMQNDSSEHDGLDEEAIDSINLGTISKRPQEKSLKLLVN